MEVVMKRTVAKIVTMGLIFSLLGTAGDLSAQAAVKRPKPAVKQIVLQVKKTKRIRVKNVTRKTRVAVRQTKASKRMVAVRWSRQTKQLRLTGKKAGNAVVRVRFQKKDKTYWSKIKVRVQKPETKKEQSPQTPSASAASDDRAPEPSSVPQETPAQTEASRPTGTPEPTNSPNPTTSPEPVREYDYDTPLKEVYSDYFLMGAAINGSSVATMALNHEGMTEILKTQFNSTVLSNLMKPQYILDQAASQKSADGMPVCKFDTCDPALAFCQENGIKMRGHTLIWHNQVPEWLFYEDYDETKEVVDAATMEKRMESYIKQVLTHCQENYPGVIYCWDVVNECVSVDAGSYIVTKGGWKLRASTKEDNDFVHEDYVRNYWYAVMGETYVEKAFYYARKYADEGVKLFYNDYNPFLTDKMNNIYKMAEELKSKGLIDGIGLQPTVLLNWPALDSNASGSFKTCLETFAKLGLEIQITELSFKIDEETITDELLEKQADRYREFMGLLLKEDSDNGGPCNITSVTVFGICDDYPLYEDSKQNLYLWDKNCVPKPCFYAYMDPGLQLAKQKGNG